MQRSCVVNKLFLLFQIILKNLISQAGAGACACACACVCVWEVGSERVTLTLFPSYLKIRNVSELLYNRRSTYCFNIPIMKLNVYLHPDIFFIINYGPDL